MTTISRLSRVALALAVAASRLHAQQERTAGETYKNIQVLNDVAASTFMNTMFFQRYALGVSCSYCHVDGQWDKDDKPAKAKAREMIRMVLDLNRNRFGGKEAVNCVTCHRGSTSAPPTVIEARRMTVDDMLARRVSVPAPAKLPPPPGLTADSVISRYLAALGGRAALEGVNSRRIRGNMITAEGAVVAFEEIVASAPTRWVSIRHFGGTLGDFATGLDGTIDWNKDNRGVVERTGEQRQQDLMNAEVALAVRLRELYSDLTVTGQEMVSGAPAIVLSGTSALTGRGERLYFDAASGLLTRRTILARGAFGATATDTYYEMYRNIGGVMVPILVSEFTPDFGTVKKLADVEPNGALAPDLFTKPKP